MEENLTFVNFIHLAESHKMVVWGRFRILWLWCCLLLWENLQSQEWS